jgi:nitroreductase
MGASWATASIGISSAAAQAAIPNQIFLVTSDPLPAIGSPPLVNASAVHAYPWIGEKLCHKDVLLARTLPMPINAPLRDYLLSRRSVGMAFLQDPGPTAEQLHDILTIGTRVPDHGKLVPWRLVVFEGDDRARAGERLATIAQQRRPDLDEAGLELERRQFLPAPLTIGVLFSPRPSPKSPELEQLLSAGNVCFSLLNAAFAVGLAASWVTRWYAFDAEAQQMLGARGGERFVGFVHIGTPVTAPEDRERPALESVVTRWQG